MPVFNGAPYLRSAVQSILDQTWNDFELLVLDDGSTDKSVEIIHSFRDRRIRLVRNERNIGLTSTLNLGLDLARGHYVARMDCDDQSKPNRLMTQVAFLENNLDVGVVGSWAEVVNEQGKLSTRRVAGQFTKLGNSPHSQATTDAAMRFKLLFANILVHSSVMLRKDLIDRGGLRYDDSFKYAEDYEFWVRCSRVFNLAIIPEILVSYRQHPRNVSSFNRVLQRQAADRVRITYLKSLGVEMSPVEAKLHLDIANFDFAGDPRRLTAARDWLSELLDFAKREFRLSETFHPGSVSGLCWYHTCGALADYGLSTWKTFQSSPFSDGARLRWKGSLLAHCLVRKQIASYRSPSRGLVTY